MSIQSLLNTLEQKVQQLTQAYQADSDKKINAKFNRTLFTEDFEIVGFYLKEIQQSLTKLCSLPHQNEEQIVFMAEHLLGQCTASVSYTHLDVYKRQFRYHEESSIN